MLFFITTTYKGNSAPTAVQYLLHRYILCIDLTESLYFIIICPAFTRPLILSQLSEKVISVLTLYLLLCNFQCKKCTVYSFNCISLFYKACCYICIKMVSYFLISRFVPYVVGKVGRENLVPKTLCSPLSAWICDIAYVYRKYIGNWHRLIKFCVQRKRLNYFKTIYLQRSNWFTHILKCLKTRYERVTLVIFYYTFRHIIIYFLNLIPRPEISSTDGRVQ